MMTNDFRVRIHEGKARLYTPYNPTFVSRVKLLGGRWDSENRCWTIDERVLPDARAAMREIYGRDDALPTETVDVIIAVSKDTFEFCAPLEFLGRVLSSASGRDSGARAGDGVLYLSGAPESGGSAKNWRSVVPEGSKIKLIAVPKALIDNAVLPEGWTMEVIGETINRAALEVEKTRLLARLAEIDALLN